VWPRLHAVLNGMMWCKCSVPNAPTSSAIIASNTTTAVLEFFYPTNSIFDQLLIEMNSVNSVPVPSQLINVIWSSPSTVVIVHNLTAGDVYTWTACYLSGGLPSANYSSDADQPLRMRKLLAGSLSRPTFQPCQQLIVIQ
jgi:hypothetical protein